MSYEGLLPQWLQLIVPVLDEDMRALFKSLSKTPKFKWELDVVAHRSGKDWNPPPEPDKPDGFHQAEEIGIGEVDFAPIQMDVSCVSPSCLAHLGPSQLDLNVCHCQVLRVNR